MKKPVILLILTVLIAFPASAGLYGVDDVDFEEDLPSEHKEGEELEVYGFAEGHRLDELRIYQETSGSDKILEDKHCGAANSCATEFEDSFEEGEKTFYIWARAKSSSGSTVTDSSERQTVNIKEDEAKVDKVEIKPDSDKTVDVGEWQEINGTAEGENLDEIEIRIKDDDEWETDHEESCSGTECNISKEFRRTAETSEKFKIKASAGDDEKKSDEVEITWEEKDAELDVNVEDQDGDALRDAKVTALKFKQGYTEKSVRRNEYSESSESSRIGDREIGFSLEDRELKAYAKYFSGYEDVEWSNLALESSDNNESIYRYELDTDSGDRGDHTKHVAEQEATVSSETENITVRLVVDGEELDAFTAEINRSEDQEFAQVRERGRTHTEGTDTTISTKSDLESYTEHTDSSGKASFQLPEGRYRMKAQKAGYSAEHRTIGLDSGDQRGITLSLNKREEDEEDEEEEDEDDDSDPERGDVTLERVSMDSSVCKGDETTVHIEFKNQGDKERAFRLAGEGLGSTFDRAYVLEGKETKNVNYTFSDVQGSGNERVKFNTGYDSRERTVQVRDCPSKKEDGDVKFRMRPSEVRAGQSVQVSGYVDTQTRKQVDIKLDGERRTSTHTEPDGFFRANIRSETVGQRIVEVKSGEKSTEANLRVLPTVSVNSITAPDKAFEGERIEICGQVESQTTPLVVLKEDGQIVESKNADGNVCFERRPSKGHKDYEIQVFNQGATASREKRIRVFESGEEVRSFPDRITTVPSGSGVVKIELYNTHDEFKRYELELEGLPRDWVSMSGRGASLDTGQRKTKHIYITPKEEGLFETTLNVRSEGEVIYTQEIDVRSGGTYERESLWVRLRRWWRYR